MNKIVYKEELNSTVTLMKVDAPLVAKKAQPGQFIILRVDRDGERIPLTIADTDTEKGTVTIIFQIVGATTGKLNLLNEGDYINDFVGPLGKPTETEGYKRVAVIGGGVSAGWDEFAGPMQSSLAEHCSFLAPEEMVVAHSALGDRAAILGAARLAWRMTPGSGADLM